MWYLFEFTEDWKRHPSPSAFWARKQASEPERKSDHRELLLNLEHMVIFQFNQIHHDHMIQVYIHEDLL